MFEDLIEEAQELIESPRVREVADQRTGEPVKVVMRAEMKRATDVFLKTHGLKTVPSLRHLGASASLGSVELDADLFGTGEYISAIRATKTVGGHQAIGSVTARFPSTGGPNSAPPAPGGVYTLDDYSYYTKTFLKQAEKLMQKAKRVK